MSFVYHANAVAFGGILTKPCCEVIPSLASVTLSPSGGEGSITIRDYNYKGILTIGEASAYVAGSRKGNFRNTISTVTIRNLNVANMIHIDQVIARVTSEHLLDRHGVAKGEPEFTFEGSRFENVHVAGVKREIALNHRLFSKYPTFSQFQKALGPEGDEAHNVAGFAKQFCWTEDCAKSGPPVRNGSIRASLVESIDIPEQDGPDPDDELEIRKLDRDNPVRRHGFNVRIADFGHVVFGEVMLKDGERRVNMLRMTLGSPIAGDLTAGSSATNGTEMYPP